MRKIILPLLALLCACHTPKISYPGDPIAFWDFTTDTKSPFISKGKYALKLIPGKGTYPEFVDAFKLHVEGKTMKELVFDGSTDWLYVKAEDAKELDIRTNEVTVAAIVNWSGQQNAFIAGMWDECDCKRQYGLFISLPCYNGDHRVCGHISQKGGATSPFPYSIDYSTSGNKVEENELHVIAMTYDGQYIRSYLDGIFEEVKPAVISNTAGFEGYPDGLVQAKNPYYYPYGIGHNGSDFTIGAVKLPGGEMGNFFQGRIRKIAVFNRCLEMDEIAEFFVKDLAGVGTPTNRIE